MKDIKDYIPYYIGQKCSTPDGIGTIEGLPWAIKCHDRVHVHFAKMVKTENSIDGGHSKVRNHGVYAISAVRYEPIGTSGVTDEGFDMPGGIKLILRRLSDMTEQEMEQVVLFRYSVKNTLYRTILLPNGIEFKTNGFTGGGVISFSELSADQFHYLLKQGFDLFGLVDAGLAIDFKTLNQQV